jgi:hypothetical protein
VHGHFRLILMRFANNGQGAAYAMAGVERDFNVSFCLVSLVPPMLGGD